MKRRDAFRSLFGLGAAGVLIGCDSEPKPDTTATVFNREKVHQAVLQLDSEVASLESHAEDFGTTNWKEVVPKVENDAANLRGALDDLMHELGYR